MVIERYAKDGKMYRKIGRGEVIEEGAMQSLDNDDPYHVDLFPIMGVDTIGDKPSSFSNKRDFYNPIKEPGELCPMCRKIDYVKCERTDIPEKPFNCVCCGRIIVLGEKFNLEKKS